MAASRAIPAIGGNDPGNLLWIGIGRSERRRGVCAAWDRQRWTRPFILFDSWTTEECLDLVADERASAETWVELGRLFVAEFPTTDLLLAQDSA
ncbi:hypothetical protein ACFSBZ_16430 [Amnibacterium flavum]|uniref:hypothetical protein n=1 Tax=Amnibacterium flavum TaxID=2173173 RepID=UPI00105815BD|nr:hypothetical protein [Amnibacterium flavum]